MNLQTFTREINTLCTNIKTNFIEIGKILKYIRDKQIYKEKYNSFHDYLVSQDFEFSKAHAYRFLKVVEDPELVSLRDLNFTTLWQLAYVSDKDLRKELQPPIRLENLKRKLERSARRTDEDIETESDSREHKCRRQLNESINDIETLEQAISALKERIVKVIEFAKKFDNAEIDRMRIILEEWIEKKKIIT